MLVQWSRSNHGYCTRIDMEIFCLAALISGGAPAHAINTPSARGLDQVVLRLSVSTKAELIPRYGPSEVSSPFTNVFVLHGANIIKPLPITLQHYAILRVLQI
jgi:hypothetical protein